MIKRSVSLFLVLVFLFAFLPVITTQDSMVHADTDGTWHLVSFDMLEPNPVANTTVSVSDGSASFKVESPDSGDVFESSAKWTAPATSYKPGGTVTITISIQINNYVWNGEDDGYIHMGLNYMTNTISARIDSSDVGYGGVTGRSIDLLDADGNYKCEVYTDNGKTPVSSESREISAQFPSGYENGDQISLYVTSKGGLARYNYVWQAAPVEETTVPTEATAVEEPTPTPVDGAKTIVLSGKVLGVDGRPMRRMKLDFSAWFDGESGILGSAPEWALESSTDARGLFKAEIPVPEGQEKEVQIMMRGELRCILPDGSETYYIVDVSEEQSKDNIFVSSWFSVDTNNPLYDDSNIIPVSRTAAFYHLPLGGWTFGGAEFLPEVFVSNVSDIDRLMAHAYTYNILWDAQFVGGFIFDEIEELTKKQLRVETNWQQLDKDSDLQVSHFSPADTTIRLEPCDSMLSDLARFVILHEYGHYFDLASNGGYYRTLYFRDDDLRHINHGGYMNGSTSDSFVEGFATAYAGIVQLIAGMDAPHLAGFIDLSQPGNYLAWGRNGTDEELAIALLLYQMIFSFDTPQAYWSVISSDQNDFSAYYEAFEDAVEGDGLEKLQLLARAGGLYKMRFGNKDFDHGEPFYNQNKNTDSDEKPLYDPGEEYADLMFTFDEYGFPDFSNLVDEEGNTYKLEDFSAEDLTLGHAADANRPERRTLLLHPNSWLHIDGLGDMQSYAEANNGSLIQSLLLKYIYKDGRTSQMLFPIVENNGRSSVYIGLPGAQVEGRLEVSIPGGKTIFEEDLSTLQRRFAETFGQTTSLAQVSMSAQDLITENKIIVPVEGSTNSNGFRLLPTPGEIEASNQQAGLAAEEFDLEIGLESYAVILGVGKNNWGYDHDISDVVSSDRSSDRIKYGSSMRTILIALLIIIVLMIAGIVIILLMKNKRNQRQRTQYVQYSEQGWQPPSVAQPLHPIQSQELLQPAQAAIFCPQCGNRYDPDSAFCGHCGQKL